MRLPAFSLLCRPMTAGVLLLLAAVTAGALLLGIAAASAAPAPYPTGKRLRINGYKVVHVAGTPEQMGEQHGRLMLNEVRRAIRDLIGKDRRESPESYKRLIEGAMKMEPFQPEAFRKELHALAKTTGCRYEEVVAAQLFGDVNRSQYCTSYAAFGEATRTGECIAGRNMDYWDNGVQSYAAMLLHCTPNEGLPFVTVTWAGIINGWTAMNSAGIVVSNNNAYGGTNSMEGISTCFMLRKVAQFAHSVEEGIKIVQEGPRACGTNLLIAGGNPPDAAILEFDHDKVIVRRPEHGYVLADNSFRKLGQEPDTPYVDWEGSRYSVLSKLLKDNLGKTDRTMNFAAAPGVPINSMNLHSAVLFPKDLTFRVSMGKVPACEQPYRTFRMTERGIVAATDP